MTQLSGQKFPLDLTNEIKAEENVNIVINTENTEDTEYFPSSSLI
jgi:hypothetical protein